MIAITSATVIAAVALVPHPVICSGSNPSSSCAMPCPSRETLNLQSSQVNSPTGLTANIWNTGTAQVTLISYYLKDSSGNEFGNSNWAGPSISPNAVKSIDILIDGKAFTFQSSSTYNVILITSTYDRFTFTVTT